MAKKSRPNRRSSTRARKAIFLRVPDEVYDVLSKLAHEDKRPLGTWCAVQLEKLVRDAGHLV